MKTTRSYCLAGLRFSSLIIVILATACNLPFTPPSAPNPPIANSILTQAAATIYARVDATQTLSAQAAPPSTLPPGQASPTSEPPQAPPIAASLTATFIIPQPTSAIVLSPTPTTQPSPTTGPIGGVLPTAGIVPTVAITPVSPYYYPTNTHNIVQGTHFYVDNVNLSMCYGYYWSVFMISNNGTNDLESLYLYVHDVASGQPLYGPVKDNDPFMVADNTCAAGYLDRLISGGVLYVGGKLNDPSISHHTLSATVRLCSDENLKGACFQKTLEFVVP
jgi:hypothetical protein